MKTYLRTTAALALSLMSGALVPMMKASDSNRKTRITIDQSIDVQGKVLSPGSYVIKLLGSPDRCTVEIFNAAENHLITTVLASPAYRLDSTGESEFTFYDGAQGQPRALRTWFYPGDNVGFEFRPVPGQVDQSARQHTKTTTGVGGE